MSYKTTHQSLASFFRYGLGDAAHRSTVRASDGRSVSFEFDDPENRCPELAKAFFSIEGAPVTDGRVLLEVSRAVRQTMTQAIKSGRWEWENER